MKQHTILSKQYRDSFRQTIISSINKDLLYAYPEGRYLLVSVNGDLYNADTMKKYKSHKNQDNYDCVNVKLLNGRRKSIFVHRIVAETFLAYLPTEYYEVNHINGNKDDNSLSNLEWNTRQENLEHSRLNKLTPLLKGDNNGNCKFSFKLIQEMRELYSLGFTRKEIMLSYGIDRNYLANVLNNKKRVYE